MKASTLEKTGFPPIADKRSEVLILGSLPGDQSILAQEYYANPRNTFWHLIGCEANGYGEKKQFLLEHRIALWDVLFCAEREGALDNNIRQAVPNDFSAFFSRYPGIRQIFFNGQTAETLFRRHFPALSETIPCTRLPSSSPANAGMTFIQKKERWQAVADALAVRSIPETEASHADYPPV